MTIHKSRKAEEVKQDTKRFHKKSFLLSVFMGDLKYFIPIDLLWINRSIKQHIIKLKMRDVKSPMVISFILPITLVPIISCWLLDFNP